VTQGHNHDTELELGDKTVVLTLTGKGGAPLDVFHIGKQGTDLISTYVRRAGEPAVMAMDRALLWQVKRLPNAWQAPTRKVGTEKQATQPLPAGKAP